MGKFIVKRLLLMIPILVGVVFIVFTIMSLTPGDPGRQILGTSATAEQVAQLNAELGFDRPFLVRFVDYLGGLVRGDFGTSYRTRTPFTTELLGRLPITLKLGLLSFVFSSIIGISLGILSAVKQYSLIDTFSSAVTILFASIPGFFLAMVLIYVFGLQLGWFPTFGTGSWRHYVLPVVTLTLSGSVVLLRLTRTTMLEAIRQDYIRTAVAKGCSRRRITWKHAFKNAVIPVVTVMGINMGTMLGGAVIVETVFTMPGMGSYILAAIRSKDIPVVLSSTVILSTFFCMIMILVDCLHATIDPRIRERISH